QPAQSKAGSCWEVAPATTRKILTHFHPQTEDCSDKDRNRLDRAELKATLVKLDAGRSLVRFDGTLRMKRPFYPNRDEERYVDCTILGFAELKGGRVESVQLTTKEATYAKEKYGGARRQAERKATP